MHDKLCNDICEENPNMMIPWYLMASYAYYWLDDPILSDACFDQMCKEIDMFWDIIEHYNKDIVDYLDIAGPGTCSIPEEGFPERTKSATLRLLANMDCS